MIIWAKRQIGRQPEDDNEADAIAVGLWAAEQFDSTNLNLPDNRHA